MGLPAAIRVQQMKDIHKTACGHSLPRRRNHGPAHPCGAIMVSQYMAVFWKERGKMAQAL